METYEEFIQNILDTRGRFGCGDEYCERHHIMPRSMDGTNEEENLIDLYAREHYEAHRLLALENPENYKLIYAWWCMSTMKSKYTEDRYEISADEYEEIKIAYSEMCSRKYTGDGNPMYGVRKYGSDNPMYGVHRYGEDNPFYGKHHTEESRDKMKISSQKRWSRPEEKEKIRTKAKERLAIPENNPMYGKHHTNETIEKMRNSKCIPIYCVDKSQIYKSSHQAERDTGVNQASVWRVCNEKQKTAGGYQWKYLYDQTLKDGKIIHGAISLGLISEEEALTQLTQQNDL